MTMRVARCRPLCAVAALIAMLAACTPAPTVDVRASLTRPLLDQVNRPLMLIEVANRDQTATMTTEAQNGDVVTWRSGDDVTMAFRDGVLVATRGFGNDTMSADVSGTLAALASGSDATYPRFHTTLDGNQQIVYRSFQCRITDRAPEAVTIIGATVATTRSDELCSSPGLDAVRNSYWRDADGLMWKSRQWIGEETGTVTTERLVR